VIVRKDGIDPFYTIAAIAAKTSSAVGCAASQTNRECRGGNQIGFRG
jgi:hypothetical protein